MTMEQWLKEPWKNCSDVGFPEGSYPNAGIFKGIIESAKQATESLFVSCGSLVLDRESWDAIEQAFNNPELAVKPRLTVVVSPDCMEGGIKDYFFRDSRLQGMLEIYFDDSRFYVEKASKVPEVLAFIVDKQKGLIACSQGYKTFDDKELAEVVEILASQSCGMCLRLPRSSSQKESYAHIDQYFRYAKCLKIDNQLENLLSLDRHCPTCDKQDEAPKEDAVVSKEEVKKEYEHNQGVLGTKGGFVDRDIKELQQRLSDIKEAMVRNQESYSAYLKTGSPYVGDVCSDPHCLEVERQMQERREKKALMAKEKV